MIQYFRIACVLATFASLLQCLALEVHTEPEPTESGRCIDSLHVAEQAISGNPYNLDSIKNALYPLNSHPAITVIVNFYFNKTQQNTSSVPVHPSSIAGQELNIQPDYIFQWLSAPIFLPLGMEVVEAFGIVFISISKHKAQIVLSSVCEEYATDILSKITAELLVFPNTINDKARGFAVQLIPLNNGSVTTRSIHYSQHAAGKKIISYVFLFLMGSIPIVLSLGWAFITSLVIQKQQLIFAPSQLVQDSNQLKISIFLGLAIVCLLGTLIVVLYDSFFIHIGRKVWLFYILLPVPVALPVLLPCDILMATRTMRITEKLHKLKDKTASPKRLHFFKVLTVFESVIITLFLQIISFHVHWFLLMLVNFPMEVGSIFVAYTAIFCSLLFLVSGFVHSIFGCACGLTSKFRVDELCGIGFLFYGLFILSVVYCITVIIGGMNYHDGMSLLMPNFLPYIIVGFSLWFFKKSKITETPPGAVDEEQYLEEKMKLLANEMA